MRPGAVGEGEHEPQRLTGQPDIGQRRDPADGQQ
jgi:hypothetical protein